MKLRIKGDSIRLRLTKSEIDQFVQSGSVEEITHVGASTLIYQLKKSNAHADITAEMNNSTLIVYMPEPMANQWVKTERVGYEQHMPLPDGGSLFLLLEKDFKCLDATHEDQSDMYENPMAEFHK